MKASIVGAPFPMTFDVGENLRRMVELLNQCRAHDVVVFPEVPKPRYQAIPMTSHFSQELISGK